MSRETSKSGRNGKSSKTARVMNLLIDPDSHAENNTAPGGETGSEMPAPAAGAKRTISDENTQDQIRNALETELTDSAVSAPQEPAAMPVISPEPPSQDAFAPQPPAPQPSAPPQETAPKPEPTPSVPEEPVEDDNYEAIEGDEDEDDNVDDYICFNVTQALVEDKAEKYMKMFGMCTCNRCRIDVIALALSNLPAKYVVAKPKDMIPRLSMYESKYSAAVITQVMKACKKVIELPHHQR